jgi:hypothetical protein
MAGPGPLELGLELVVHNAMQRFIRYLKAKLLTEPGLHLAIAAKASRDGQAAFELLEHGRRERLLASRRPGLFVGQ